MATRALWVSELSDGAIAALTQARVDPRHDHLDALTDDWSAMVIPDPEIGLVIHFNYLWKREHDLDRDNARCGDVRRVYGDLRWSGSSARPDAPNLHYLQLLICKYGKSSAMKLTSGAVERQPRRRRQGLINQGNTLNCWAD